jgi:AraC-like DNA-binding protein
VRLVVLPPLRGLAGGAQQANEAGDKCGVSSFEHWTIRMTASQVRDRLSEPITTEQVAACVGLDPSYFFRVSLRETPSTFRHYLRGWRIERAKRRLRNRELRVKQVPCAAGFHSVSHFHHLFPEKEGRSPPQYQVNRQQ